MKRSDIIISIIIVTAFIISLGSFLIKFNQSEISNDISDWGDFGGYIGGTLSLISVILIYYTYRSQSKMNYRNQFEAIFFEMLRSQREIYRDINGAELFVKLRGEIETHFQTSFDYIFTKVEAEQLFASYFGYHISSKKTCLHYFRHLYHIIKYIHSDSVISPSEKKKYIDMVQAEMNDDELFITLFNTIWWHFERRKKNDYLTWLDDYSFFENMQSPGKWFDTCKKQLFAQTKWKHFTTTYTIEDLDLGDDYENEQWNDTIIRLHKSEEVSYSATS